MRDFHTERMARALDTLKAAREYQGKRVTDTGSRGWYPMTQYGCGGVDKAWDAQQLANVYTKSGLIWACIKEKASTLADLQLEVGMKNSDGTFEPIEDHDLLELFYENPWYSYSQLIELFVARLDLTGASFNKKIESRGGMIGAIAPLPTSVVEKVTKGLEIKGYRLGDDQQLTPPEEIMEHSYIAPGSYQCYVGPLQTILSEFLIDEEREKITKELLRNKNMPGYFLEPQDGNWTRDQIIQIKESMNAASGGDNESRGKGVALPKGAKVTMGPSVDDINYKELNSLTESRICMAFGVSPLIIQAKSGMDAGQSYNNYSNARKSFYEETILPLAAFFTDGFNRHLIPQGENLSFRFATADIVELQEDVNEVAKRSALLFEKGVATRDESREMVNLQPVEGDEGGFNKPPAPIMAQETEEEQEEEGKVQGKSEKPKPNAPAAIGSYDDAIELEATLKKEFRKQEQEAIQQLAETGSVDMAAIGQDLGPSIEATLTGISSRTALTTIRKLYKDAGLSLETDAIAGAFDVVQPGLERNIREQAISLSASTMETTSKSVNATMKALREELIKEGVRGPNTVKALTEGVKRVFKNATDSRARTIAITESSRAVNDARVITSSDTGLVQGFTPVISSDACEKCQVYVRDEDGNAKATGVPRYPYTSNEDALSQVGNYDNRTVPPYHPNCKCTVAPVFNDESPPLIKTDGSVEGVGPYEGGGVPTEEMIKRGAPIGSPIKSMTDLGTDDIKAPKPLPRRRPGGKPAPTQPLRQFTKQVAEKAKDD